MAFSQKLNMACEESFEIVPNKKAKSSVWNHFGFLKENDGPVDKTRVACKLCSVKTILKYSGNTTNLTDNLHCTGKMEWGIYIKHIFLSQ